ANRIGKYFTYVILTIAFATLAYWLPKDTATAINAFTAVLIIACPCAVALSIPFTFGNALRLLGRTGFYLKNTNVIEQLNKLDTIVFDKTGTITRAAASELSYKGKQLMDIDKLALYALAKQSNHPKSRQIATYLDTVFQLAGKVKLDELTDFQETIGRGTEGRFRGISVAIKKAIHPIKGTAIIINGVQKGIFVSHNQYRKGFVKLLKKWQKSYQFFLLSGDNDQEKTTLSKWLPSPNLHFQQSPKDKLQFIKNLQTKGYKVGMFGDGLNDAGALQQADMGIVIAEDTNNFTPACDAILDAQQFERLPDLVRFAQRSLRVVFAAYGLALVYNVIGLSFAVQGTLSPVIAAILMPLSSITIVAFGVGMTYWLRPKLPISIPNNHNI
ncbi:MAG: HAD-IC family P-type ATPase, partial [Bacteroidota bacterium]